MLQPQGPKSLPDQEHCTVCSCCWWSIAIYRKFNVSL